MPPGRVATTVGKGRGRVERRPLRTTPTLTLGHLWAGLRQGFGVTRERTVRGVTTTEVVYGITGLGAERADAGALLELVRDRWKIENQLHDVRDVALGEDASRVRSGAAPQVLAALRNAVLHLQAEVGADSQVEAREVLQIQFERARKLVGIP